MTAETTTFSKCIRNVEEKRNSFASPESLMLFRQITGHSDWNEMILAYEKQLKKGCICVIIVAALYFFPIAIKALLK
jgi:hypothetical protein